MKSIKYDTDVSEKLLSGVEKTAKIVATTMGPVASNVILSNGMHPRITKDGITVINHVEFADEFENVAAQMVREASSKTNQQAGDGTTGTAILLESIFRNGLKHTNVGGNKIQIRNGIQKASVEAVKQIEKLSTKISGQTQIRQIAKISGNQSDEIADVLTDVFTAIGEHGVIKVEEGNTVETHSTIINGCQYDEGYLSPFFATNDKMETDFENPVTIFCDKKLSNLQEMIPLLESVRQSGRPLFIMCEEMDGEALQTMIINRIRQGFPVCVVKAPGFGQNKKDILQDLAVLTNSEVISDDTGVFINNAVVGSPIVGSAKRIIVTREFTTIIGGSASKEALDARLAEIDTLIKSTADEYEINRLKDRRAKLDGGIAIVSVGGRTKSEAEEKRDLIDDAFNAVKSAIRKGIVPGGGSTLISVQTQLEKWFETTKTSNQFIGDEEIGARIFINSLDAPIRAIVKNAGLSADMIVEKLRENSKAGDVHTGYDVLSKKYVDMIEAGIIDPAEVIISEVENASSIAGLMLTTTGAIIDIPDNKDLQPIQP